MKMNNLPPTGFLRLKQILGDKNSIPPILPIIPVSKSTWWAGIKTGEYPAPIKFSANITVWRVEDIQALIAYKKAPLKISNGNSEETK